MLGGPDMHVDRGSTINLTCVARFSPAPPPDVEWRHNNEVIIHNTSDSASTLRLASLNFIILSTE